MNADLYEARNSIYCYEGTNVLVNKLNIRDNKTLQEAESEIVATKLFELRKNKMIGDFDIKHFTGIHKYLFEDIYPFAGKFRTENIAKGYFSFAEWEYIDTELEKILQKLHSAELLKNDNREQIVKDLAYYTAELNVLHPFREGNGRTIREFIRELAYVNGYIFDLQKVSAKEILDSTIKSVVETDDLEKTYNKILIEKKDWSI